MIIQEKNYIDKQKKKYLKGTFLWLFIIAAVYCAGLLITRTRGSFFTVFSGVLVIGAALNFTRLIGYGKYKDGHLEWATRLEQMKGGYDLFHSCIMPDTRGTYYFEHIIVTSRSIYLLSYEDTMIKRGRLGLENKLMSKGIPNKSIHIVAVHNEGEVKALCSKIERDACFTSTKKDEYTTIINEMLM